MHPEDPRPVAPERSITIAFDGACKGNPGPGGYAAILVNDHTQAETMVRGGEPQTTNNRMELRAAIEALNALPPGAVVTMIGDSEYVLKGMTAWMPAWKEKGWRTTKGKPVLNVELWQALEAAAAQHAAVRWTWVRGHKGHALNERVDQMASEQARWVGLVGASQQV
jgi:ribonuclease HI